MHIKKKKLLKKYFTCHTYLYVTVISITLFIYDIIFITMLLLVYYIIFIL